MDATKLKYLAIAAMTCDHVGYIFYAGLAAVHPVGSVSLATLLRVFGRLTMPIMCYFIVQGALHTRSAARYARRLFVFALLSEIPFDLAFSGAPFDAADQNVFFTLLFGLLAVEADRFLGSRLSAHPRAADAASLGAALALGLAAEGFSCDYGFLGVALIFLLYRARGNRALEMLSIVLFALAGAFSVQNGRLALNIQIYAALAAVPLWFYDGRRGSGRKYLFYVYYPAHLLALAALAAAI